jgi:hypothetical protein
MKKERKTAADSYELPEDEPIFLVGDSKSLRGTVRLNNPGQEKVLVREANLRLKLPQSEQAVPFGQSSLSVTLQPGQAQTVKLSLEFDPHTPPGQYQGEMDVNGQTRQATVFVAEVVRLTLNPSTLVFDQVSGAKVLKQVVFSNEGNVPLTIGPIGPVQLGVELLLRRGAQATLAAAGEKKTQALDKLIGEFISGDSGAILGDAGFLEVQNLTGKLVLQPGEVKLIQLEIHLPDKLECNHRYIGRVPFYTSELEFIVVPVSA